MTQDESEPKRIGRTNSGNVILFDPSSQTIKTEKRKKLDRECNIDGLDVISLTPEQPTGQVSREQHLRLGAVIIFTTRKTQVFW